eukprot:CAMPEP_0119487812 /NCGR_PEP_ID=MMETSP1344-20130328/13780_1 /TAXON_ID=236787 /ORGANISM="Florenciella parvula, Strain CCMP2471" /LENGTH=168 /DNA_ID=CAMNT_0007522703 /DNA_START=101 /DNA_END=607 /DNA_ORIENTATION=-
MAEKAEAKVAKSAAQKEAAKVAAEKKAEEKLMQLNKGKQLLIAARNDEPDQVAAIIGTDDEPGLDANYQDFDGWTALHYAAANDSFLAALVLINVGRASTKLKNNDGETAGDLASQRMAHDDDEDTGRGMLRKLIAKPLVYYEKEFEPRRVGGKFTNPIRYKIMGSED